MASSQSQLVSATHRGRVQPIDRQADAADVLAALQALIHGGRADEALQRARRLRMLQPSAAPAYTMEAQALLALGRVAEALQCLHALPPEAVPDRDHVLCKAKALQRAMRHADAVPLFLQALALKIDDAHTHFDLGSSFKQLGMKAEAAECVRTALTLGLGPGEFAARGQLVFLEREACRWAEAQNELDRLRPALCALPPGHAVETSPFAHAVLVADPPQQLKAARHYALHVARMVQPLPHLRARDRGRRLRLGYLSADFHTHATSQLLVQVLEQHDRGDFEVFVLSTGPDDDSALRRRVVAAAEHFVELRGQDFRRIAQRVRSLGIDILVDLKGATQDTLLPVFAARPAPLQVSWLGFPGTTGAPFIDYLIGDPVVTPVAHAEHYSEKLAQLPRCYQPNDAHRERALPSTRDDWGVPEGALLLCAFHQSYKITSEVFDVWCSLLDRRPDALLWLLQWNSNVQATLRAAARVRGIDPGRLLFAPVLPLQQHLSRLAHADIYLDAWPCNAHTTAGEALWVGVPVVTLAGEIFAQRVASSLLQAVALGELICDDPESYCERVLALAADAPQRARLRKHLDAQRSIGSLFDGQGFARDLEALLRRMWQRALAGEPPAHLLADPPAHPSEDCP